MSRLQLKDIGTYRGGCRLADPMRKSAGPRLCTLLVTLLLPMIASAGDQDNSAGKSADRAGCPPYSCASICRIAGKARLIPVYS